MPWLQKKGKSAKTHAKPYWYIHVPTAHGYKAISTGTVDKRIAGRMERMVDDLYRGKNRDVQILSWLLDRKLPVAERLRPLELLHHYENNLLEELRARRWPKVAAPSTDAAMERNANDFVDTWLKAVRQRSSEDHAHRYARAVRSFMPEAEVFGPDRFDYDSLLEWSTMLMEDVDNGGMGLAAETARRYRVGLLNFIDHLVASNFVNKNELEDITPPKKTKPRDRHLLTPDAIRLVKAFEDETNVRLQHLVEFHGLEVLELQAFNALLSGAGVEVSVALDLKGSAVRPEAKEVHAPGTKSHARDRVVRVANWAWPWVEALARIRRPSERLFASIRDRWMAADAFNAVIGPLAKREPGVFADYWMRDGRHTYAVRAIKAGTPSLVVATQLGHVDATLVDKVYGRYKPNSAERDYWERMATSREEARDGALALPVITAETKPVMERPHRVNRGHRPNITWPPVKELLRRLRSLSVVALAEELDVSDQALRKHLKKSGVTKLPDGRRSGVSRPRGTTVT